MGDLIDFEKAKASLRRKAERYVSDAAQDSRELTKQDILLVLCCDPMSSSEDISEQLWDEYNEEGDLLVRQMLEELREEGLISYRSGLGWHLEEPAKRALDEYFDTEVSDE